MLKVMKKLVRGMLLLLLLLFAEIGIQSRRQEEQAGNIQITAENEADERLIRIPAIPEIVQEREDVQLPTAYDCRQENRAPLVKDQKEMNNCWAYAGTSALESALLPEETAVFSADHMTYWNSYAFAPEEGGAYVMAVSYLTSWQGPVLETEDPSGDGQSPDGLTADKQVLDVRFLDYKDYTSIKQTVLLYGGVESSIYMDFTEEDGSSPSYEPSTYSYCYSGETEPNHDVVIIGWDDEYPAEQFKESPQGDGAFLCQNSWGTEFGDGGIFYVSYYDSNIGGSNTAYTRIEDAGYFDALYQSDLCGFTGQVGYNTEEGWFANIFTAEKEEALKAAGFYTTGMESTYEIYWVPEFADSFSLNDRIFVTNGYLQYAGYHTVEFPEELVLEEGQRFALVVHLTTKDAMYPIAVEYEQDKEQMASVTILDGESYISDKGKLWSHTETDCESNVCLKAYINRNR